MTVNFIVGDSIPRGFGSAQVAGEGLSGGGFADVVTGDKWFWPDASPERTLNDLMVVNGLKDRFVYLGFPINDPSGAASRITGLINDGTIRSGDRILLEDAGDNIGDNSDTYYSLWDGVIAAAKQPGITVKAMTMFDTSGASWQALTDQSNPPVSIYGSTPSHSQMDRVMSSGSHGSANQCIRDAMTNNSLTASEFAADALSAAQSMRGQTLIRIVLPDWIHPNMWGQWRFCRYLLVMCGLNGSVTNIDPVRARVSANYLALQYNAPSAYWTQGNALKAIDFCLKNTPF